MFVNKNKVMETIGFQPISFVDILKKCNLEKRNSRDLNSILIQLQNENLIERTRDDFYYKLNIVIRDWEGPVSKHRNGYGFIDFEQKKSAFITAFKLADIMNNDIVSANIATDPRDKNKFIASINKVVRRATNIIVGTLKQEGNGLVFNLEPLDKAVSMKINVFHADKKYIDTRVKVKIIKYGRHFLDTEFVESYGPVDSPKSIIDALVSATGIQTKFSPKTEIEAEKIPNDVTNIPEGYKDLTNLLTVTIDGETTKDFDDAISVVKQSENLYTLYVHIADVAYYVKEGSSLDQDALERGNSVYLVDRTIPMLPKKLSDGICSLNPNVKRLTLTAEMDIDNTGKTLRFDLYRSAIISDHRLTYTQVNNFLKNNLTFDDKLSKMILHGYELSKILDKKKHEKGYVDLEIEEAKVLVDDIGKPIEIKIIKHDLAEVLIENFMVRANEEVATFMTNKKFPCVYRVHDVPSFARFESLKQILKMLEIKVEIHYSKNPKVFSQIVEKIKVARFDNFIKTIMLRTMEKAIYSPVNIGHFGLASKCYSHFTSPIRRYSDTILHRMIHTFVFDNQISSKQHFENILPTICNQISNTERIAMELERKVDSVKKAEFMQQFLNQRQQGQIVTIFKYGLFIEFNNGVSGLIALNNSQQNHVIEFENTEVTNSVKINNKTYKIGDQVDVIISSIDIEMGQIGLTLANGN